MFGGFGAAELGIILVLVLIIFGAGKLPEIGSGMGRAISNFKKGVSGKEEPKQLNENENV